MKAIDMITFKNPKSPVSESYRTLRTNIRFMSFKKNIKSIAITSPHPGDGKTTVAINLGITMAQAGSRVILMDCDLRNPSVHKGFLLDNNKGLTNILAINAPYNDCIFKTEINNLYIIPSGPKPPNPSELLGSDNTKELLEQLKSQYDYILIDTPPVLLVTDAALMASISDGTLIVITYSKTEVKDAAKVKDILNNVGANIIGAVNNKTKLPKKSQYSKYYSGTKNK